MEGGGMFSKHILCVETLMPKASEVKAKEKDVNLNHSDDGKKSSESLLFAALTESPPVLLKFIGHAFWLHITEEHPSLAPEGWICDKSFHFGFLSCHMKWFQSLSHNDFQFQLLCFKEKLVFSIYIHHSLFLQTHVFPSHDEE